MKKHKLAKKALKHPELFAPAELAYFRKWLELREKHKSEKDDRQEGS